MKWSLYENGKEVESGSLNPGKVSPRKRVQVAIPYTYSQLKADNEYFVKVQFLLKEDKPWAPKGYVMAEEQLPVKASVGKPAINEVANASAGELSLENSRTHASLRSKEITSMSHSTMKAVRSII